MWNLISPIRNTQIIDQISKELDRRGHLPKFCDLSQIGPLKMASVYSKQEPNAIIRESVQCGMDSDEEVAILKALVETVERLAIEEGMDRGDAACNLSRSDGFAAFPTLRVGNKKARLKARGNALAEAIERYAWATWWDHSEFASKITLVKRGGIAETVFNVIQAVRTILPVQNTYLVRPLIENSDFVVSIFFMVLEGGGVLSGGACSKDSDIQSGMIRAAGELSRHMVCAKKILNGGVPSTFYERRLAYMASTEASERFHERIQSIGNRPIVLPDLLIDQAIRHSLHGVVEVHRCLFQNQPAFVGGALERLCL